MDVRNILLTIISLALCHSVCASNENNLDKVRENFVTLSAFNYSPNDKVTDNFIKYSDYGRANDVLQLQLYMSVHLPDVEVNRLFSLINENGSFSDIDYTDRTRGRWQPTLHLTRLYSLVKLYVSPSSKWYKDIKMHENIHKAVNFWMKLKPTSDNWWHNDIGVPRKMTAIFLMIRDEITPMQLNGALDLLKRSEFGKTGQNKVWLAANNLMKALLINDEQLLVMSKQFIAEEISISDKEGIQKDWSFHQHGPQIQFGNYGQTYAESVSFLLAVLQGTSYAFSKKEYDIVANLMKEGICWSVFKGVMDPSFCGRQVFKDSGRSKAYSVAVAAQNMAMVGEKDSSLFINISNENLMPDKYKNTLTGAKYYLCSDCGIYRTEDWYASIRMHSERTIGFEFTNKENTNAWFSADGALLIMQHGSEYDNIFAHWDWRAIPGITSYDDNKPLKVSDNRYDKENKTKHVGGLVSDQIMCTTMELNRDGLHAFKSVFFFKDLVVALGADIYSNNKDIIDIKTSLEQNNLIGDVKYGKKWAWHDGRGYILLDHSSAADQELVVTEEMQYGKWDAIDPFFKNDWSKGKVFKCIIKHCLDKKSAYAYAILPKRTASQTKNMSLCNDIKVLRNDDECQSVAYKEYSCEIWHRSTNPSIKIYKKQELIAETYLDKVSE